jgi:hypothetical protein
MQVLCQQVMVQETYKIIENKITETEFCLTALLINLVKELNC